MPVQRIRRDDAHCREDGKRDGKIVVAAFLRKVGGGEIDGDVLGRQRKAEGSEGGANPFPALPQRLVRQADNGEIGIARRDLHLHIDRFCLDAFKGESRYPRHHAPHPRAFY